MSWRGVVSSLGTSLVLTGLGGFALLMASSAVPGGVIQTVAGTMSAAAPEGAPGAAPVALASEAAPQRTITHLAIPSIELDTAVVVAPRIDLDDGTTWKVPAFVAGHAQGTAGAGEPGNAVLLGHLTSLTLGNVFQHLDRVQPGALVEVANTDGREYRYRVAQVENVARADVWVLDPTPTATLSIITCSGVWLPTLWDYTERLVVRAELLPDPVAGSVEPARSLR